MLDFVDKTLNQMPLTIKPGIVVSLGQSPLVSRDHRFCTSLNDVIDKLLGRIASVSDDTLKLKSIDQVSGLGDVMSLSSSQSEPQWIAQSICTYVDFGAEPTSAASKGLTFLPAVFFGVPAAHGWARTIVLSTSRFSISGSWAKCAIIRSQIPLSHQRENRLYTLFQFPYSSGKNRHCAPLLNIHSTPSIKRRHSASFPTYISDWLLKKLSILTHFSSDSLAFMSHKYVLISPNVNRT